MKLIKIVQCLAFLLCLIFQLLLFFLKNRHQISHILYKKVNLNKIKLEESLASPTFLQLIGTDENQVNYLVFKFTIT